MPHNIHGKSSFLSASQFSGVEKCPQIQIVPRHIKVPKIAIFFPIFQMFSVKIGDNNAERCALMCKTCMKIVVFPIMSKIF